MEATFPAIAAGVGLGDQVELTAAWARKRHAEVTERLAGLVGASAALSPADRRAWLSRVSAARRSVRLGAFETTEDQLTGFFDAMAGVHVGAGELRVLVGDFGSGKSETAETWHRGTIADLTDDSVPLPVWLRAADVAATGLDVAVDSVAGGGWRGGRGIALVVDGLDETDPANSQRILDAARLIVAAIPTSRVVLTARPGVLQYNPDEQIEVAGLDEDQAAEVVELLSGSRFATSSWTADMRSTVRRPFFALAAGSVLSDEVPSGEADLIDALVRRALSRANEHAALSSESVYDVLVQLAVALTQGQSKSLAFQQERVALASKLVASAPTGVVFTLPIFQQWFAAQGLLADDELAAVAVSDEGHFARWRWVAAVALLLANNAETTDRLVRAWVKANPGAAAWILQRAFPSKRAVWGRDAPALDPAESGPRLLDSLRIWSDSLGPLSASLLPIVVADGPFTLGVHVDGPRINVGFADGRPDADTVELLPQTVHPFASEQTPGWRPWFSGPVAPSQAWPWLTVRDLVANGIKDLLASGTDLGGDPDGVWRAEHRYNMARILLRAGNLFHSPLPAADVRRRVLDLLSGASAAPVDTVFELSHRLTVPGTDLSSLVDWIETSGCVEVSCGLPGPDLPLSESGGFIWGVYSPDRLMRFEVEVYGRACDAYDESIQSVFSAFGWSLPTRGLDPVGVFVELRPGVGTVYKPRPESPPSEPPCHCLKLWPRRLTGR